MFTRTRHSPPPRKISNDFHWLADCPLGVLHTFLLSVALLCGLLAGPVAAQTPSCTASDVAVTAVITDATDTAGRTALAGDCATLLDLMDTLRGTASLNWATTLSMASWDGITVTGSRVTRLDLISNQLTGTIPDFSGLTNLEYLSLGRNQLTGTIPATLGVLANLTELYLHSNQLTGTIPPALGNLAALEHLWLYGNDLDGSIPPALGSLANLQELLLTNNDLSGTIPAALGNLSGLTTLALNDNDLSGSIPALSGLTSLTHLLLTNNDLSGAIPTLSTLTRLERVDLSNNDLSGAIPALSALTSLEQLLLSNNDLSGAIPALSALTNLQQLHLTNNDLSGAIPALSALTQLTNLQLDNNDLSGSIPDLSGLTSLQFLLLHNNQLSGSPPTSLGGLTSLWVLRLDNNQLSGSIPDLSGLTNLQFLYLHNNQLSGRLPTWWASLSALTRLHLAANRFTGGIPAALGSLSLTHLSLCGTDLDASATLPSALETRRTDGELTVWSCLRIEDATATEGTALSFPVTHSTYPVRGVVGATGGLPLTYATADGTATSADYTGTTTGSLTIPANTNTMTTSSRAPLRVPTTADSTPDTGETLTVTLSGWPTPDMLGSLTVTLSDWPTAGVFPLRWMATGTITDPPPPPPPPPPPRRPALSIGDARGFEGTPLTFAVTLSRRVGRTVTVEWTTRDGTARAGTDYTAGSGTLRFPVGTTRQTITVPTHDNTRDEASRTFTVILSRATGGVRLQDARGRGLIRDDDDPSPGRLEIPAFGTVQSGVRVLSGWICEARQVHIEFITPGQPVRRVEAAYGTERADTVAACGDMANGFGLLWNWNILGDGRHTVRVLVDGRVWMTRQVLVTTLGEEFRRELAGTYALADFPTAGETVTVAWQEAQQNFVLAAGEPPDDTEDTGADFPHSVLENPAPGSFQSGIGIVSGWICEAEEIEVEFLPEDGEPWREEAAYGTERLDTVEDEIERESGEIELVEVCGDTDNGFGLLFNWNQLGDGVHTVVVRADGAVLGRRTVRMTTLGEEFRRGLSGTYALADFPTEGETVTIEWREAQQNFVITDRQ